MPQTFKIYSNILLHANNILSSTSRTRKSYLIFCFPNNILQALTRFFVRTSFQQRTYTFKFNLQYFAYLFDDFQLLKIQVYGYYINEYERHHNTKCQILPYSKFHRRDVCEFSLYEITFDFPLQTKYV